MIGQKLIKILQTLDPAAFRRLGGAIASPYFTYSPLLLKLYALLKKEYPEFDSTRLSAALGLVKPPIRLNATPQHGVFTCCQHQRHLFPSDDTSGDSFANCNVFAVLA